MPGDYDLSAAPSQPFGVLNEPVKMTTVKPKQWSIEQLQKISEILNRYEVNCFTPSYRRTFTLKPKRPKVRIRVVGPEGGA
jgi:hypothetical protein